MQCQMLYLTYITSNTWNDFYGLMQYVALQVEHFTVWSDKQSIITSRYRELYWFPKPI